MLDTVENHEQTLYQPSLPFPVDDEIPVDPNLLTGYKRYNLKNRRDIMPTRPFHLFN